MGYKKWAKSGLEENDVAVQNQQNSAIINGVQIFYDSLPKMESHYYRATASKLYLEPMWTSKSQLYQFYKSNFCKNQNQKAVSIATFHKQFEKINFPYTYRPKKDLCDICVSFQTGNISEDDYNEHIKFKDEARAKKKMTINNHRMMYLPWISNRLYFARNQMYHHSIIKQN
ncbi:unnamed protein product [Psylliodes chrysocephalus]|uniref:Uncharacterized protein n=1 Tax=Psylliodes chrysocephalus TaxID=3402493 RepID=A0A9P0CTY0_9CUCU|nr:unnamed protein product [Psylliodes chrysocephala]